MFAFSIIIPTLHEARNIPALAKRIAQVDFGTNNFEVILVDDNSQDGTVEVVNQLSQQYPWLRILERKGQRSLSQSILDGFQEAQYPILITMDADLSHPPEKILEMLKFFTDPSVDYVIGSRYIENGSTDDQWPITRKLTSRLGAFIANLLIFSHAKIKDPLSGFCGVKKSTLQAGAPLKPIGWKIGLEIMIKCRCQNIKEFPIHFSQRQVGYSKLNLKISLEYLLHIVNLIGYKLIWNLKRQ